MSPEAIEKELQAAMREMQQEALPMLLNNIDALQYHFRGTLKRQLHFKLYQQDDAWILDLNIPGHGKVLDVKRYFAWGATVFDLTEWVKSKGKDKFSYVPGYDRDDEWPENWAYRIALGMQNTEQLYSGGASGGVTRKGKKRTVRFIKRQWLHTPYLGLWAKKRNRINELFLDIVHGDFLDDVLDTYNRSARSFLPQK